MPTKLANGEVVLVFLYRLVLLVATKEVKAKNKAPINILCPLEPRVKDKKPVSATQTVLFPNKTDRW